MSRNIRAPSLRAEMAGNSPNSSTCERKAVILGDWFHARRRHQPPDGDSKMASLEKVVEERSSDPRCNPPSSLRLRLNLSYREQGSACLPYRRAFNKIAAGRPARGHRRAVRSAFLKRVQGGKRRRYATLSLSSRRPPRSGRRPDGFLSAVGLGCHARALFARGRPHSAPSSRNNTPLHRR